jgi:hypothetical protein
MLSKPIAVLRSHRAEPSPSSLNSSTAESTTKKAKPRRVASDFHDADDHDGVRDEQEDSMMMDNEKANEQEASSTTDTNAVDSQATLLYQPGMDLDESGDTGRAGMVGGLVGTPRLESAAEKLVAQGYRAKEIVTVLKYKYEFKTMPTPILASSNMGLTGLKKGR